MRGADSSSDSLQRGSGQPSLRGGSSSSSRPSRAGAHRESHRSDSLSDSQSDEVSERQTSRGRRIERLLKELRKAGACPKFEDHNPGNYVDWCSKFKLALQITVEKLNLCYLLEQDPDDSDEEQRASSVVVALIIQSAPIRLAEKITAWQQGERTACAVWSFLRTSMIGDERAYVRTLESEFTALKWKSSETWEDFLRDFDALDRRMCAMGKGRDDDSKRVQILNAALGRRSQSGREVHSRMAMLMEQHSDGVYAVWLREICKLANTFATEEEALQASRKHRAPNEEADASSVNAQQRPVRNNRAPCSSSDGECFNFRDHG